jgi:hypothetical protein
MAGVFITRGMRIQIPPGGLTVSLSSDGSPDVSLHFLVSLDMCPYWLEIAVGHLRNAAVARGELQGAKRSSVNQDAGSALEHEFSAGMQAITSSAIALDALYASVRDRITVPASVITTWQTKRTARHRQVSEVFRRAFRVKGKGFRNLSTIAAQLYRFRDLAVHPAATFTNPVPHPIIGSATEWRFVSFGYESAHAAVRGALALVVQLARIPRAKNGPIVAYCRDLEKRLQPLVDQWASEFGPLLEDAASRSTPHEESASSD